MKRFLLICIVMVLPLILLVPTFDTWGAALEYRTLTIKTRDHWTDAYIYTDESLDLGEWPGTKLARVGDVYMITLKSSTKHFIIHARDKDGNYVETGGISLVDDTTLLEGFNKGLNATINIQPNTYSVDYGAPGSNRLSYYFYDLGSDSDYRVVSSADWVNREDDFGILNKVAPGVYRKTFYDAQVGEADLKVQRRTEGGTWETIDSDQYVFTVNSQGTVTIELTEKDGDGVIDIHGQDVIKPAPVRIANLAGPVPIGHGHTATPTPFNSRHFAQWFLFGILAVCIYLFFLLLRRNRHTGDVTPDGKARQRARLSEQDVVKAVKETMPMPSAELDKSVLEAIQNLNKPPKAP